MLVLMGLVVSWSISNMVSLGRATGAILSENYRSILAAENMIDALERQDSAILLALLGDLRGGISQFRSNESEFLQWLARAKDNITIEGEQKLVASIEKNYNDYRNQFSVLTEANDTTFAMPDLTTYRRIFLPAFETVRNGLISLRRLNEETMYAASNRAKAVASRAIWSTAIITALGMMVAFFFSLILAARILRPVRSFMDASRKISAGDYSIRVHTQTTDELGQLAHEFNGMASQLARYHELNIEKIISERNKGEAILASIGDGIVVFDAKLNITAVNPAARQMLDLVMTELSSLKCSDIIANPSVCALIHETIETGSSPGIPDERRIISLKQAEQTRHYLFSIATIQGREKTTSSGVVLLLRDVTRLKEVEQLKSEFVMAASHELRTPLTSLGMSIDLIIERAATTLPEKDRNLLQAAHEEIHRMKALVNDLLDLSKIESGRIEMEFREVGIPKLFDHISKLFKSQVEEKDISLSADAPGDLPNIAADANKIVLVLSNLVSNALRYVPKHGHISLSAHAIGSNAHVSVSDNGPGIPREYQSRIFEKFAQVEGRENNGTGLGLAISKEIVRAHGGTIWVESSPGKGAIFTFTIPLSR